jgi:antitoxin component HigA of HigAB toxin-antitoxin module
METLKYKVITSKAQYASYCNALEALVFSGTKDRNTKDEIALLTLLIEKWDAEHNSFNELDPIQLLRSLMEDQHLKAKDLVDLLDISKGYASDPKTRVSFQGESGGIQPPLQVSRCCATEYQKDSHDENKEKIGGCIVNN